MPLVSNIFPIQVRRCTVITCTQVLAVCSLVSSGSHSIAAKSHSISMNFSLNPPAHTTQPNPHTHTHTQHAHTLFVQRALSKTLRDALDVYHVANSETSVSFIKLEDLGIEMWQTALAVMMVGVTGRRSPPLPGLRVLSRRRVCGRCVGSACA
jgi:hypothetical protein